MKIQPTPQKSTLYDGMYSIIHDLEPGECFTVRGISHRSMSWLPQRMKKDYGDARVFATQSDGDDTIIKRVS